MKLYGFLLTLVLYLSSLQALRQRNYKSGRFMVVALLPITNGSKCENVQAQSVGLVEKFIYGVNIINQELKDKMNLTVGYLISDSCSKPNTALTEVVRFLSKNSTDEETVAILGPVILENIIITAGILSYRQFPQVNKLFR